MAAKKKEPKEPDAVALLHALTNAALKITRAAKKGDDVRPTLLAKFMNLSWRRTRALARVYLEKREVEAGYATPAALAHDLAEAVIFNTRKDCDA